MKPGFSPKTRIFGLSVVFLGVAAWLTPAFDQFANCRTWQAKVDADIPYSHEVGKNRHVAVSNFRRDSATAVGVMPYGPAGGPYITYVPVLPAKAVGKPLPEDLRIVMRTLVQDPQKDVIPLMQHELVTGIIRRPAMTWMGKIFHEDDVIKNWIQAPPAEWYVLDTVPRQYIQWKSVSFLLPMLVAVWCAYRIGCNCILLRPETQILPMAVLAGVSIAGGLILLLLQPGGPAAWNTICPWLATVMISLGAGSLPAFASQLLTNQLKKQEMQKLKAANAAMEPEDPNAAPFEPTPTGFILRDGTGKHEYLDAAVEGIKITRSSAVNDRKEPVVIRSIKMRILEGKKTEAFTISNILAKGAADPLQPFFSRLIRSMGRRYAAEMRSTGELKGEGWILSGCGLTLIKGDKKETIGPKLLNSGEWIGDRYCLWSAEKEEPVLQIASSSENVYVLAEALPAVLPSKLATPNFATGLGRLRCTLACDQNHRTSRISRLLTGTKLSRFRCYDAGVQIAVAGPMRTLKYTELDSSTWNLHVEGGQKNPVRSLTLSPDNGPPVTFEFTLPAGMETPAAILDLKQRVVEATSTKLLEKLARTGSAAWTSQVTLQFEGFSVNGSAPIAYASVQELKLDESQRNLMLIWRSGKCQVPTHEENFDAGWQVFQLIRQTVCGEATTGSPQTAGAS